MEPIVPREVVIPSISYSNICTVASVNVKKKPNETRNAIELDSIPQLHDDRRQGQDMLRQLVYGGDTTKHDKIDMSQVDWKAVIELATKLHKREQRLLRRLQKKRSRRCTSSESTERTVGAPSSPLSAQTGNNHTTASASTTDIEGSVQHQYTNRSRTTASSRCLPWSGTFTHWLTPWRRSSRTISKSPSQQTIRNPSSFSINLIACTASESHCEDNVHVSQQGFVESLECTTIQRQRHLQQVVAVGCHSGIFSSFKRPDVHIDTAMASIFFDEHDSLLNQSSAHESFTKKGDIVTQKKLHTDRA